jgi:hypothetical protein
MKKEMSHFSVSKRGRSGNAKVRGVRLAESRHDDNAKQTSCVHALNHGLRPVLILLDMMSRPDLRRRVLGKKGRAHSLLELERLWKSLGYPTSELWQRLHFFHSDNCIECSREKSL